MASSNSALAINNAFALVGKSGDSQKEQSRGEKNDAILPTAKTRSAINLLSYSTPQGLEDDEVPLRPLLQDLFNWDGNNHVNKPLIQAFKKAINTPGKYPHAVELTAYLAAMSPMLEADQLARLYPLVDEVDSAFAPTKYTIQLGNRLKQALSGFSKQRIEKLSASLWRESHAGRWWNITAGLDVNPDELNDVEYEPKTADDIFDDIKTTFYSNDTLHRVRNTVDWNPKYHEVFAQSVMSQEIAQISEEYSSRLEHGDYVHPDIAVYLSGLPWLAPYQRPESPVNGLLKHLLIIFDEMPAENRRTPKKPQRFSELFPNIYLQAGASDEYPVFNSIQQLNGKTITGSHEVSVINNRISLAENAEYMSNCTLSYENRIKKGKQTLLFVDDGKGNAHNITINLSEKTGKWTMGKINARFNNSGNVDSKVKQSIQEFIDSLPKADTHYLTYLNRFKDDDEKKEPTFEYSLY